MDDGSYPKSMFPEEHPTLHLQRRQSILQYLYHMGLYWSPEDVPVRAGV